MLRIASALAICTTIVFGHSPSIRGGDTGVRLDANDDVERHHQMQLDANDDVKRGAMQLDANDDVKRRLQMRRTPHDDDAKSTCEPSMDSLFMDPSKAELSVRTVHHRHTLHQRNDVDDDTFWIEQYGPPRLFNSGHPIDEETFHDLAIEVFHNTSLSELFQKGYLFHGSILFAMESNDNSMEPDNKKRDHLGQVTHLRNMLANARAYCSYDDDSPAHLASKWKNVVWQNDATDAERANNWWFASTLNLTETQDRYDNLDYENEKRTLVLKNPRSDFISGYRCYGITLKARLVDEFSLCELETTVKSMPCHTVDEIFYEIAGEGGEDDEEKTLRGIISKYHETAAANAEEHRRNLTSTINTAYKKFTDAEEHRINLKTAYETAYEQRFTDVQALQTAHRDDLKALHQTATKERDANHRLQKIWMDHIHKQAHERYQDLTNRTYDIHGEVKDIWYGMGDLRQSVADIKTALDKIFKLVKYQVYIGISKKTNTIQEAKTMNNLIYKPSQCERKNCTDTEEDENCPLKDLGTRYSCITRSNDGFVPNFSEFKKYVREMEELDPELALYDNNDDLDADWADVLKTQRSKDNERLHDLKDYLVDTQKDGFQATVLEHKDLTMYPTEAPTEAPTPAPTAPTPAPTPANLNDEYETETSDNELSFQAAPFF